MSTNPVISSLHLYPFKSCKAVDLDTMWAGPRGFVAEGVLDRSWMAVDESGKLVSQREEASLARVKVELLKGNSVRGSLRLSVDGLEPLVLNPLTVQEQRTVKIHGKEGVGHAADLRAHEWFSKFLAKPVFVVHQTEDDLRLCDPNFAVNETDSVSFADGFQYLLTSEDTLEKVCEQLSTPVTMRRFRPNMVAKNAGPKAEYGWAAIKVGQAAFALVKPCTRCVITTIDQDKGVKTGKDPLSTLARIAMLSQDFGGIRVQGAVFGENAIATTFGNISVGDTIRITATKPAYEFKRPSASSAS